MLTEEEKSRIKDEEFFRQEIRKAFENKQTEGNKVWVFLNSGFGLWLLSTVIVGFFIQQYSEIRKEEEATSLKTETKRKLKLEITTRLENFSFAMCTLYESPKIQPIQLSDALVQLTTPVSNSYIFPEFKEKSISALLYEFENLNKDDYDLTNNPYKTTILSTLENIRKELSNLPDSSTYNMNQSLYVRCRNSLELLKKDYWIKQWIRNITIKEPARVATGV